MVLCVSMSVRLAGGPPGRRSLAVPLDGTFEHTTDIGSLNSSRNIDVGQAVQLYTCIEIHLPRLANRSRGVRHAKPRAAFDGVGSYNNVEMYAHLMLRRSLYCRLQSSHCRKY